MRMLLLLSALALSPNQPVSPHAHANVATRVSVRVDSDSVLNAAILADMAAAFANVAKRHGYDRAKGVPGWLETPYLASASTRPDIPDFFSRRKAYAEDLGAHVDTIALIIVGRRLKEAGMDVVRTNEMRQAFLAGFKRSDARLRTMLGAMRRQSIVALRLHEFLVEIDPHVSVNPKDPDKLIFDRPADQRRYLELATAIDAANAQMEQAAAASQTTASTQR
jgi:hypothetical protein